MQNHERTIYRPQKAPIKKADNQKLHLAKKLKYDEFYTYEHDIAEEMQYYTQHFANKIIYCNCDDPTWSNFVKHFAKNFDNYKLKGLIASFKPKQGTPYYVHWSSKPELSGGGVLP